MQNFPELGFWFSIMHVHVHGTVGSSMHFKFWNLICQLVNQKAHINSELRMYSVLIGSIVLVMLILRGFGLCFIQTFV